MTQPRTYIADASVVDGQPGKILVTVWPNGAVTLAHKSTDPWASWGPPVTAEEAA